MKAGVGGGDNENARTAGKKASKPGVADSRMRESDKLGGAEWTALHPKPEDHIRFQALLLDSLTESVVATDLDSRILYWSRGAERLYGYTAAEVLNKPYRNFVGSMDEPDDEALKAEIMAKGEWEGEHRQKRKDGTIFWSSVHISLMRDSAGRPRGFVAIDLDITEKKRAEESLRESQERFQQVAASAREWIWEMDAEGRYTYSSPNVEDILGYRPEELVGKKHFYDLFAPQVRERVKKEAFERAARKEPFRRFVNPNLHKDGHVVILETTGVPILDREGRLTGYRGADIDVTERVCAEEELRAEHARLFSIFDGMENMVYVSDMDTYEILFANKAVQRAFKTPLVGQLCYKALQGKDAPCEFCTNARIRSLDYQPLCWDHYNPVIQTHVHIVDRVIRWPDGRDVRFEIATDITEQKRTEQELAAARQFLRDVLDTIPVRVFWKNRDLKYLGCNRAFAEDAGLENPEEVVGMEDFDLGWREYAERYRADDRKVIETGEPRLSFEEPETAPDGRKLVVRTSKVPLKNAGGEIIGVLGTYEDITEQVSMETRLRQAERMESVGRLAGGVAHDFNNKLGVILGYAEILLQQSTLPSSMRHDLEQIAIAARYSAELTRQLLAFARKQVASPRVLDLNQTIENMFHMLRRLIGEKIELSWKPGSNLWPVRMDPGQVDQVLVNLLLNARDAVRNEGVVTIETENTVLDRVGSEIHPHLESGDYVVLTVRDNGIGMDRETLKHIFEPYYTTKDVGQGVGLGLASVYGMVQQNRGAIHVHSKPGGGTVIRIYLPRADAS